MYLERLMSETGENRIINMQEILDYLQEKGIRAERKSIYDDMEVLRSFGMDVRYRRGKPSGYYLSGHTVEETPEADQPEKEGSTAEETAAVSDEKEDFTVGSDWESWKQNKDNTADAKKQMKLLCSDRIEQDVKLYFGSTASYKRKDLGYFTVTAGLMEGPQFYGWLAAMGREIHILKPKKAVQSYRDYLKTLVKEYKSV